MRALIAEERTMEPEELKSHLRQLRFAVAGLTIALVASVFWPAIGAERNSELVAQRIHLVSEVGDIAMTLAATADGPLIELHDGSGTARVRLFHTAEGSGLYILDEAGTTRIGVAQFAHGGGGVALHGPESEGALVMYYEDTGSLRFFAPGGAVLRQITAGDQGP
jgi:hypothetical protein